MVILEGGCTSIGNLHYRITVDFLNSSLSKILNAKDSEGVAMKGHEKWAFPKRLKTSIQTTFPFSMISDDFLSGIF